MSLALCRSMLPQSLRTTALAHPARTALLLATPLLAIISAVLVNAASVPPLIDLSTKPLYSTATRDKPTLTLALSVEFPTLGAQFTGASPNLDDTYSPTKEYLGYFDIDSCYQYVNHADPDLRRFDRTGPASGHECQGAGFSGNFMNWASSSAIDVLRLGLTGGDRIVDGIPNDPSLTILQRAVLPTNHGDFWNGSNFPAKQLKASFVEGAVPNALRGNHTKDIWIANCLNRVHFGTDKAGNCNAPGKNSNLGTGRPSTSHSGNLPSDFVHCANRGDTCNVNGVREVAFGSGNKWIFATVSGPALCSNATFGGNNSASNTCWERPDTSGWVPNGTAKLSDDNFFYARVKVCETNAAKVLQDPRPADLAKSHRALCLKYPNGNYKPVGQLQKNSENVRVAAFGYLMDDSKQRYGGVLRAPMKYVGGKAYDADGVLISGTNPGLEWDETTGIFKPNPDAAPLPENKSGIINYLNQFGRTGSQPGIYKLHDPVGELYYEALRYVQGLGPTPEAVAGITPSMKDGFPVYSTWVDPHANGTNTRDYSCIRNNIVAVGDTNTWNDSSVPGNTRRLQDEFARVPNPAANEPDFHFWTKVVGAFEANDNETYPDAAGNTQRTQTSPRTANPARRGLENQITQHLPYDAGGAQRNASYYLAGMAYWANTHDIRGADWSDAGKRRRGMRVTTYMLDVNEFGWQSNPSTRHNNQFFLAAKYGGFNDKSGKGNPFVNDQGALDDTSWERIKGSGEASNYFLSSNAESVLESLEKIFQDVAKKGSSIAGSALSSQRLTGAGANIYQAQFDPAAWSGDLTAVAVDYNTVTFAVSLGNPPKWSAAALLDVRDPATRKIVVGKTVPNGVSVATPFTWNDIEPVLQTALNKPGPGLAPDNHGERRLDYLRGDRTSETTTPTLRRRTSRLGDIVNSGVTYSGTPTLAINTDNYPAFYSQNKNRTKALFVGANDGMLHAFDADSGDELFGYIPSWLGPRLSLLTDHGYVANHQSYVDATPEVSEARVGTQWKTVLVGGTGAGGQGVYALDVTNPAAFDPSKVMWEFTDRDDPDMGNVIGKPQIRKFRTSNPGGPPVYKWFAVVAGGVNNYAPDGYASVNGVPAIFLLDLSKPAGTSWALGTNYYKLKLPLDLQTGTSRPSGVVNFALTSGDAGEAVKMYVGDLHGQMWKVDFSRAGTSNWTLNKLSGFEKNSAALPFFVAKDAQGAVQPITMAPNLPVGPKKSTIVVFGTGKYLEATDNLVNASTQVQTTYALFDHGSRTNDDTPAGSGAISERGRLQAGSVSASGTVTVAPFTWGQASSNSDQTKRSGWYVDLARPGERQINNGTLFGTHIVFGSVVPPNSVTEPCGAGSGYQYSVDVLTGSGAAQASTVGLLGQPLVLELGSGIYSGSDSTGRRTRKATAQIVLQGANGLAVPGGTGLGKGQLEKYSFPGRLSWRQITEYQDLRNSNAAIWQIP